MISEKTSQTGGRIRIRRAGASSIGTCVLFDGGTVTPFFNSGIPTGYILADLQHNLLELGYQTVELNFPAKVEGERISTDLDLRLRTDCTRELLESLAAEIPGDDHTFWFGLSSGGTVILNLLSEPFSKFHSPEAAVLLSTVVDSHLVISSRIRRMLFLYGESDYIAYLKSGEDAFHLIPPSEYGEYPKHNLVVRNSQRLESRVVKGVGHAMRDKTGNTNAVVQEVVQYLCR